MIDKLARFCSSQAAGRCFILKGYAGTGKTSIVSALVQTLQKLNQPPVLLAPTGRAAKVLSAYSGLPATTIHKCIYRESQHAGMDSLFTLGYNKLANTLFVVDEASMIGTDSDQSAFGSGNLLEDLIRFVYQGLNCSLLLVGDDAQLPPVGQTFSAALNEDWLQGFGLSVSSYTLTQVVRQAMESGVLQEATAIRQRLLNHDASSPMKTILTHADVIRLKPEEVQSTIERSYREVGMDETLIITRSNKRTNLYNQGIRARILWKEENLSGGDRIMVSRNNYFWLEEGFIANGESFEIVRVSNEREMYGFHFVDAQLRTMNAEMEINATLWLDTLFTETPEMAYQLQRELYYKIAEDYPEIKSRKKLRDKIMASPYFNALQIRYAYAVTCHKAQGGQWRHVYMDSGSLADKEYAEIDDWRWIYTALTRSSDTIFILQ